MVLRHPVSEEGTERKIPNGIKRQIKRVEKSRHSTCSEADDPASRVWSQRSLQDLKGEEEKVTSVLSPCPG